MRAKQVLGAFLWTIVWCPIALFATAFSMLGDPVEGGQGQQRVVGWAVLTVGAVILFIGYWLIFSRRNR